VSLVHRLGVDVSTVGSLHMQPFRDKGAEALSLFEPPINLSALGPSPAKGLCSVKPAVNWSFAISVPAGPFNETVMDGGLGSHRSYVASLQGPSVVHHAPPGSSVGLQQNEFQSNAHLGLSASDQGMHLHPFTLKGKSSVSSWKSYEAPSKRSGLGSLPSEAACTRWTTASCWLASVMSTATSARDSPKDRIGSGIGWVVVIVVVVIVVVVIDVVVVLVIVELVVVNVDAIVLVAVLVVVAGTSVVVVGGVDVVDDIFVGSVVVASVVVVVFLFAATPPTSSSFVDPRFVLALVGVCLAFFVVIDLLFAATPSSSSSFVDARVALALVGVCFAFAMALGDRGASAMALGDEPPSSAAPSSAFVVEVSPASPEEFDVSVVLPGLADETIERAPECAR